MRYILDPLVRTLEKGEPVVLATIVRNSGSAPRTSGARMLVRADGSLAGSVGGGALEGKCQAKAAELMQSGDAFAELEFVLHANSAADAGMVCGGDVTVLLQRLEPDSLTLLRPLLEAYSRGERPVLLTSLPHGDSAPRMLLLDAQENTDIPAELCEEIRRRSRRAPFLAGSGDLEFFVEPLVHPGTVQLVGAGHVALATAECAAFAGFEVVVMDDRADFANRERYPWAKEVRVLKSFDNCLERLGPDDYVVIVTRGHLHDREVLAQALGTDAGYIGMIGSKSKRAAVYKALREEGFTDAHLQRVYSPIGLTIGADTPEEIAISIVAELVQVRAALGA